MNDIDYTRPLLVRWNGELLLPPRWHVAELVSTLLKYDEPLESLSAYGYTLYLLLTAGF